MDTHFRTHNELTTTSEPTCFVRLKHCAGLLGMAPVVTHPFEVDLGLEASFDAPHAMVRAAGSARRAELRRFNRQRLNA